MTPTPDEARKALDAWPQEFAGDFFFMAAQYISFMRHHGNTIRALLERAATKGEKQ